MKDEVNIKYSLYDIIRVLTRRIHFTYVKSNFYSNIPKSKKNITEAGFENIICEFVDVDNIIKKIKNKNKKEILKYKAMGYCTWEIAIELGISTQAIRKNMKWMEKFFKEIQEQ